MNIIEFFQKTQSIETLPSVLEGSGVGFIFPWIYLLLGFIGLVFGGIVTIACISVYEQITDFIRSEKAKGVYSKEKLAKGVIRFTLGFVWKNLGLATATFIFVPILIIILFSGAVFKKDRNVTGWQIFPKDKKISLRTHDWMGYQFEFSELSHLQILDVNKDKALRDKKNVSIDYPEYSDRAEYWSTVILVTKTHRKFILYRWHGKKSNYSFEEIYASMENLSLILGIPLLHSDNRREFFTSPLALKILEERGMKKIANQDSISMPDMQEYVISKIQRRRFLEQFWSFISVGYFSFFVSLPLGLNSIAYVFFLIGTSLIYGMINRLFRTNWEVKEKNYFKTRIFFVVNIFALIFLVSFVRSDLANRKEPSRVRIDSTSIHFQLIQEESGISFEEYSETYLKTKDLFEILLSGGMDALWTRLRFAYNVDFFTYTWHLPYIHSLHKRIFTQGDYPVSIETRKHEKKKVFGQEGTFSRQSTATYYLGTIDPLVAEFLLYWLVEKKPTTSYN